MSSETQPATFEQLTDLSTDNPTLIEGLPGHGLVASIAVDQITNQLALDHHGNIRSDTFPPVATFEEGRVRDLVRVYAGSDPDILTLQSDMPIPPEAFDALGECILTDLTKQFNQAIFLAGVPAQNESQHGDIFGVATNAKLEKALTNANIDLAPGNGILGGITGALVAECHQGGVPAAVLVTRANPYFPDPAAAKSLIEEALEPLVDFDIDTSDLEDQAEDIQQRKQQIAQQLKQQQEQTGSPRQIGPGMYQ